MAAEANGNLDQLAQQELEQVRLDRFIADPNEIPPFAGSTLSWEVTIPVSEVPVAVTLNGVSVDPSGELAVSPLVTTIYQLSARARKYSKLLGQLAVSVDLRACTFGDIDRVEDLVAGEIQKEVKARTDGVYLGNTLGFPNPLVTITVDTMQIHLVLKKSLSYFPDPTITIDLSFRLAIVPDNPRTLGDVGGAPGYSVVHPVVGAVDKDVHAKAEVPWWAWGIPGAVPALAIALSDAEAQASREGGTIPDTIAAKLEALFPTPTNFRKQNARFGETDSPSLGGFYEITFCPTPPDKKL